MDADDDGRRAGDPGSLLEGADAARGRGRSSWPRRRTGQAAPAPRRRAADDADDAGVVHALGADGIGTDDYRCFLLDPQLDEDVWLTGSNVLPGNPNVVHHVILFQVPAEHGRRGRGQGRGRPTTRAGPASAAPGSRGEFASLDDANWLAAWAPGGDETEVQDGYGVKLEAGSRIVMQVHYNLLKGAAPDQSVDPAALDAGEHRPDAAAHVPAAGAGRAARAVPTTTTARCATATRRRSTCKKRFGDDRATPTRCCTSSAAPRSSPSETTTCTRTISRGMTVLGAAGHMHLLGRKISIETNPDTADAKTLLEIPVWDFDNQGAKPVDPVHLDAGDTVRVTCQHQQWLRDRLPAFETQREDRYVIWAEGSTDEMCLGLLRSPTTTRADEPQLGRSACSSRSTREDAPAARRPPAAPTR